MGCLSWRTRREPAPEVIRMAGFGAGGDNGDAAVGSSDAFGFVEVFAEAAIDRVTDAFGFVGLQQTKRQHLRCSSSFEFQVSSFQWRGSPDRERRGKVQAADVTAEFLVRVFVEAKPGHVDLSSGKARERQTVSRNPVVAEGGRRADGEWR